MSVHAPEGTPVLEADLAEVVRHLVEESTGLLAAAGAVVESSHLPVLRADPDQMYSVLQNLLTNAIKFASPGSPVVVRISARREVWFELPDRILPAS